MENQLTNKKIPAFILLAAFVIVITGIALSASIIKPLLMALFIGVICAEPLKWI